MTLPYDGDALRGRIAVVAGSTRGAGRGIAAALGEVGATVICTGRTAACFGAEIVKGVLAQMLNPEGLQKVAGGRSEA